MKKEILFNYFLSKAAQKEQELLNIRDARVAQLAIIFAKVRIFRRYPSGCTMEDIIGIKPEYAQELFLNLCLDAEKHEDHLLKSFDFRSKPFLHQGGCVNMLVDEDIKKILEEKLYPKSDYPRRTLEFYRVLAKDENVDLETKIQPEILDVNLIEMTQLPEAKEAMMIDRAWQRLTENEHFINLLQPYGKYDQYGRSHAYMAYAQEYKYLEIRALAK